MPMDADSLSQVQGLIASALAPRDAADAVLAQRVTNLEANATAMTQAISQVSANSGAATAAIAEANEASLLQAQARMAAMEAIHQPDFAPYPGWRPGQPYPVHGPGHP